MSDKKQTNIDELNEDELETVAGGQAYTLEDMGQYFLKKQQEASAPSAPQTGASAPGGLVSSDSSLYRRSRK